MATAEFKKLKRFPGVQVNTAGRVELIRPGGNVHLAPQPDDDGRPFVGLFGVPGKEPGKAMHASVARLVLEAFDRPPKPGEVVGYRNGDYTDVKRRNLFWSTRSENARLKAKRDGKPKPKKAVAKPKVYPTGQGLGAAKKKPRTRDTSPARTRPSRKLARAA